MLSCQNLVSEEKSYSQFSHSPRALPLGKAAFPFGLSPDDRLPCRNNPWVQTGSAALFVKFPCVTAAKIEALDPFDRSRCAAVGESNGRLMLGDHDIAGMKGQTDGGDGAQIIPSRAQQNQKRLTLPGFQKPCIAGIGIFAPKRQIGIQIGRVPDQPFIGINRAKIDLLDAGNRDGVDPAILNLKGLGIAVMDGAQADQLGPGFQL